MKKKEDIKPYISSNKNNKHTMKTINMQEFPNVLRSLLYGSFICARRKHLHAVVEGQLLSFRKQTLGRRESDSGSLVQEWIH